MNIVFLIGTGRCGSSLIHEMLSRHENVGFISNFDDNLHFLDLKGRWNNIIFRTPIGKFTRKGRIRFAPSEAYRLIGRRASQIYVDPCRDLTDMDVTCDLQARFRDLFLRRYERQGKPLFVHKYTGWSRIRFFSKIFPEAKFIHIVRDGRSVANSWLQMPWWGGYKGPEKWLWGRLPEEYSREWEKSGKSYIVLAGIAWKILIDSYEESSCHLDNEKFLQIRYEDFVENPRSNMDQILSFVSEKWTDKFNVHFQRQAIRSVGSRSFDKDLTPEQNRLLFNTLESKLSKYGYV